MDTQANLKTKSTHFFNDNPEYFPTPKRLFQKMWAKLPDDFRREGGYILEPSAGSGHLLEYMRDKLEARGRQRFTLHAIEQDQELVATLRGKGFSVVDYDFLTFSGLDKYDLIIANPPFSEGDQHLLKAIEILYSGHILFLINAETLRNPYTNTRKMLAEKLRELNADIEYIPDAFVEAERKTGVEAALIHINVERKVEEDLFENMEQADDPDVGLGHDPRELVEKNSIEGLVASYNRTLKICTQSLLDFYKNYFHVFPYLQVVVGDDEKAGQLSAGSTAAITPIMKRKVNELLKNVRKSYWREVLTLDAVRDRMTQKKRDEFLQRLQDNEKVDFTAANIRQFVLNLVADYDQILTDAVVEIFDSMTREYAWHEDLHNNNVHYFNGWKTNHAFRVNKKVILPFYGRSFVGWSGQWDLWYDVERTLDDVDKVMNYFDGRAHYKSMSEAIREAFQQDQSRGIESTYFKISVFKKGTCHLVFKDDDILRRFNVVACKGKNWLFNDYGHKPYEEMSGAEKDVVKSFEDPFTYKRNVSEGSRLFRTRDLPMLENTGT